MGLHFINAYDSKGLRGRFFGSYNDKDFETLLKEINGKLPKNYIIYHLDDSKIKKGLTSK